MTAPPAGALEACLLLVGVSQEIRLLEKFGNNTVPIGQAAKWATEIDAALLAALRLRERCEGLEKNWRVQNTQAGQGPAGNKARRKCANDLARVLEESATGDEAGSA